MMPEQDKQRLLKLARDSITTHFSNKKPDMSATEKYSEKQGVFVTLHKYDQLRGCIGFPEPVYPLNNAIADAARAAAFEDPRFPPVTEDELREIEIEISVLTVPEEIKVDKPEEFLHRIKIGRDGLIIRHPYGSGLLLPQVPVELRWDVDDFLKQICRKAGLPENSWQDDKAKLFKFQAEIFSEKDY